jgi:hypothetical protein
MIICLSPVSRDWMIFLEAPTSLPCLLRSAERSGALMEVTGKPCLEGRRANNGTEPDNMVA